MNNQHYSEFKSENLRILNEVRVRLDDLTDKLLELTEKQREELKEAADSIDAINSIYSNFNNPPETVDVRALLHVAEELDRSSFQGRESLTSLRLLIKKIYDSISISMDDEYPFKGSAAAGEIASDKDSFDPASKKFKWITFQRNKSWFITDFNTMEVVKSEELEAEFDKNRIITAFKIGSKKIFLNDAMIPSPDLYSSPYYVIIIDSGKRAYAADLKGREIYSSKDLFSDFTDQSVQLKKGCYRGWLRLFGRNHIYIKHQ